MENHTMGMEIWKDRGHPLPPGTSTAPIEEAIPRDGEPTFAEELADEGARGRLMPEAAEGLASFTEKREPSWYPKGT